MTAPGGNTLDRGLYSPADYQHAADTIRRIGLCNDDRLLAERIGNTVASVRDARLVHDLVETTTPAVLRAMVVQLTTPELRPAIPVVFGPTSGPAGSVTQPTEEGVGGLATPTPPAPTIQLYRAAIPPSWELYCVDSGRAVKVEGDRCLSHGAADVMCKTAVRAPRCRHQVVSATWPVPVCSECGAALVRISDGQDGGR